MKVEVCDDLEDDLEFIWIYLPRYKVYLFWDRTLCKYDACLYSI